MEIAHEGHVNDARKTFALALKSDFQNEEVLLLKEEYLGPTFSTAVLVDINKEKLYEMLDRLREIEIIDIMEPEVYEFST